MKNSPLSLVGIDSRTRTTIRIRILGTCIAFAGLLTSFAPIMRLDPDKLPEDMRTLMLMQVIAGCCFITACILAAAVYLRARTDPELVAITRGPVSQKRVAIINGIVGLYLIGNIFLI